MALNQLLMMAQVHFLISTVSNELMENLDKVPIHNLIEENSFELVNYGIQIRNNNKITVKIIKVLCRVIWF